MAELVQTGQLTPQSIGRFTMVALTRGEFAIVDPEDYLRINASKWLCNLMSSGKKRAMRQVNRQSIYMHHEVLCISTTRLREMQKEVDHVNGNSLDNRKENLRIVTHTENMQNTERHRSHIGYSYHKQSGLYVIYVTYPGRRISLGYCRTEIKAAAQVRKAQVLQQECETAELFKREWNKIRRQPYQVEG